MELLSQLVDIVLHLDAHLNEWAAVLGPWLYIVVFLIVFCETGLVVTPFLPGDSLLFALGALSATEGSPVSLPVLMVSLFAAGVLGDATNYAVGKFVGVKAFEPGRFKWINQQHLRRTHDFYERHGGKTIILARFMPIVRTFAPFVAGIGTMTYRRFAIFNVTGAALWVGSFLSAGFWFGNIPSVKTNFHYVILGIIVVSTLPIVIEFFRARAAARAAAGRQSSSPSR